MSLLPARLFLSLLTLLPWIFPGITGAWVNSWLNFLPFLTLFFVYAAGWIGWGFFWERRIGGGAATVFLSSSVFSVGVAFLLGHLHLLNQVGAALAAALIALGVFFLPLHRFVTVFQSLEPHRLLVAIVALVFGIRFFSGFLPQAHGDPLLYHLLGPRLWVALGAVQLHPELPNALLASAWEYLYIWPQLIWRSGETNDLIAAQIFSQWTHLFWGWGGSFLLLNSLFQRMGVDGRKSFFMALAGIFATSLQWTGALAKNDVGIAFWGLGAIYLLFFLESSRTRWIFGGILAGFAVAGKVNAVLFLGPAALLLLAKELKEQSLSPVIKKSIYGACAALAAAAPFYLRNYLETANPFFPMFHTYFPSPWVSRSWELHFADVQPGAALAWWQLFSLRLGQLVKESPLIFGLPLLMLIPLAGFRRRAPGLLLLAVLSLPTFLIFCIAFPQTAEIRYLGATLYFLVALGAGLLWSGWSWLSEQLPAKASIVGIVLLFGIVLASSRLPFHLVWKTGKNPAGEAYLLQHTAGDSKAWIRNALLKSQLVAVMGDNETYYLAGNTKVTVVTERPDIDAATREARTLREFIENLCRTSGAEALLDARPQMGLAVRFPEAEGLPVFFRGVASAVYDLPAIEEALGLPNHCGRQF